MNYLSKLDEMGFIPRPRESEDDFINRAESWLSIEDKLESWAESNDCVVRDSTEAVGIIYRHMRTKPFFVPLVEKELPSYAAGQSREEKIDGVRIPVSYIRKGSYRRNEYLPGARAFYIGEDLYNPPHEIIHSLQNQLYRRHLDFYNSVNMVAGEFTADYPALVSGLRGYTKTTKWLYGAIGGFLLGLGLANLRPPVSLISVPPIIYTLAYAYGHIQGVRVISKLKKALPDIQDRYPGSDLGYLLLRLKPTEALKLSKKPDYLRKIKGLRGEIIRKRL